MIVIVTSGRVWTREGKKRYYDISVVMAEVVDWQSKGMSSSIYNLHIEVARPQPQRKVHTLKQAITT
jgi:hypothetical protein